MAKQISWLKRGLCGRLLPHMSDYSTCLALGLVLAQPTRALPVMAVGKQKVSIRLGLLLCSVRSTMEVLNPTY